MRGRKPVGRWVAAWVCGVGVFVVMTLIFGAEAAPDGFQLGIAQGAWARLAGLFLAAVAVGVIVPLVAGHDLPGLPASAMGVGLVVVAQIGRSVATELAVEPADYWLNLVAEAAAVAIALALTYAVSAAVIQKIVGVERREAWRREVRVGARRARIPTLGIFLAMGAAVIASFALAYAVNGGRQGEGVGAFCLAVTALVAALLMQRAAPSRDSHWFGLSLPIWTALLPAIAWVIVGATGDEALPLAVAMSSVGTSPFAFCGAGLAGAMVGFWIAYRG